MATSEDITGLAQSLISALSEAGKTVACAESCTGGWIAKSLTDIAGSSVAFGYGVVSYSNEAKTVLLGVRTETLEREGAVSESVVTEMAKGALAVSGADLAVAVSGVAGPDGGTAEKPVGTVWFAWARRANSRIMLDADLMRFDGDRDAVRAQTVLHALEGLKDRILG